MKRLYPDWEFIADTVMGGVSKGSVTQEIFDGRAAAVLRGNVSLDNNGGFVQMAFDLRVGETPKGDDAWGGLEVTAWGNGEAYDVRLRTGQLTRPWQSFRTSIHANPDWQTLRIPFTDFVAHRVDAAFDPSDLRRIGIVAIGREFSALIAVSRIEFYGSD